MAKNSPISTSLPTGSELAYPVAFAALVMGALAMGISPVFVRFTGLDAFASAFWRVALALPLLLIWAKSDAARSARPLLAQLKIDRAILLTGLLFAGDLFFWHLSIMNTNVANAALMACLAPVWVVLLAKPLLGETPGPGAYPGLAICLVGVMLLIGGSYQIDPSRIIGDIYGLITSFFFGLYILAVRSARQKHSAGVLTFSSTLITAIVLLAVTLIAGQNLMPQTWQQVGALLGLGFISHTGGQGLLAVALGSLGVVFSSLVIFIEAIAAAIFGWMFLSENLSPMQFAGGTLVLAGIWVARPQKKPADTLEQLVDSNDSVRQQRNRSDSGKDG